MINLRYTHLQIALLVSIGRLQNQAEGAGQHETAVFLHPQPASLNRHQGNKSENSMMFRYRLIRLVMNIVRTLLLVRIKVTGLENIPKAGPCLVTVNHMSTADTPVLLMGFPLQQWRYFAGEKWEQHPVFGPIMTWLGAIYINRDQVDRQALRRALQALEEGAIFGLAPEGSRSKIGELTAAKDGAAYLASRTNAPILPVGLVNTDVLFANFLRLRRTTVEIHIGEMYQLPDLGRRPKGADLPGYTELIMVQIAALLPERYHGQYANSPALTAVLNHEDPWPYCAQLTTK